MILDYWLWVIRECLCLSGLVSGRGCGVACSASPWCLGLAPGRSDCLHLLDVLVLIKAGSKFPTVNYPLLFNAFVWMETGGSFFLSVVVLASLLGSHIIAAVCANGCGPGQCNQTSTTVCRRPSHSMPFHLTAKQNTNQMGKKRSA